MRDNKEVNHLEMPSYIEDILTNNYCPSFLRMSMIKESDEYRFNYKTDRYKKINVSMMNTLNKLILLKSIMNIKERNEEWLISIESYKLDTNMIYSLNNSVEEGSIRILYYPDKDNVSFSNKLCRLADELVDRKDKHEAELVNVFKDIVIRCEWNRAHLFLDKHILRLESQTGQKAS